MVRRVRKGFESAGLVVEVSEIVLHERNEPDSVIDLFDSNGLTGEDLAEIDLLAFEADSAAGGDGDGFVVERIFELRQALVRAHRRAIQVGRRGHCERLMWPLIVVAVDEVIEPGLLLKKILSGWFGCFQFEGEMHALVASVLLRATGLDPFDADAEPEPPHG